MVDAAAYDPEPILVVTTGGTIDKVYFDAKSNYEVGESVVGDLLRQAHVAVPFELLGLLRKDSLDIIDEDRSMIRERIAARPERRVIVTHGTDTMTETARALAGLGERTIVLTGALQPAAFQRTDADFNIGCAVGALQSLPPGVYIAMNGRVFDIDNVVKNRAENRFEALDESALQA